jgi:hypothetical protein
MDAFAVMDPCSRLLGGYEILCPPKSEIDYQSAPRNALTFGWMGVDGVHHAILKVGGIVRDDSPIVQVSPMDSDDVIVLADSFLNYLADGSQVSTDEMLGVIDVERIGKQALVPFLRDRFDVIRLLDEHRIEILNSRFGHLIERKNE